MGTVILSLLAAASVFALSPVFLAPKAADSSHTQLQAYAGTWQVHRVDNAKAESTYRLSNACSSAGRYFVCEQKVDDKLAGLLVFIQTGEAGHYATQTILPEGRATGLDTLIVEGNRWTFNSTRQSGGRMTRYRNVNTFENRQTIRFEQAQSTDGKTWTVTASGEQKKVPGK